MKTGAGLHKAVSNDGIISYQQLWSWYPKICKLAICDDIYILSNLIGETTCWYTCIMIMSRPNFLTRLQGARKIWCLGMRLILIETIACDWIFTFLVFF